MFGIMLIVLGLAAFTFAVNSPIYIALGLGLIYLGIKRLRPTRNHRSGNSSGGGWDGTTHTGQNRPDGAYTDRGYVNFNDGSWRQMPDGSMENYFSGQTVERDFYGNYRFGDDDSYDSSSYHSESYGGYSMDYEDD